MSPVSTTQAQLRVRLANSSEVEQALALRYQVFNAELDTGLPASRETGLDEDEFDPWCEHLIVTDCARENAVVGTYRILRRSRAVEGIGFYTDREFDLGQMYRLQEEPAEIGRSCVHPDYRNGSVISLLWKGLGDYMTERNIHYLMGCGSVHTQDARLASKVYAYLKAKDALVDPAFEVRAWPDYRLERFDPHFVPEENRPAGRDIPPLFKGYVRAGARFAGDPAVDREFGTVDFFILFNIDEVSRRYGRHYLGTE